MNPIRPGGIWWVEHVKSPHNPLENKTRRMLVIHHEVVTPNGQRTRLFLAGISTSVTREQIRSGLALRLPDSTTYPNTTSGLTEPCWVVADWVVVVTPCKLSSQQGYVKKDIVIAVQELMRERKVLPVTMVCTPNDAECGYCRKPA